MYIALAARPLPKWFHLILSILLFNLSCATVYVYIMTRNITTSTQRFEAIPAYVVSVLFFVSGCLSLSMTKLIINENLKVAQVGVALSLVTIVLSVAAVICTLLLSDVQDKYVVCIYNLQRSQCLCRNDNNTESVDNGWYDYENISGCNRLDSLYRCMVASIALDAVGAFICFLAFSNFGLIWVRKRTEKRSEGRLPHARVGSGPGRTTPSSVDARRANSVVRNGLAAAGSPPSPIISPGAHSDWDGWLFSHPVFRQIFSEFRHVWFPPSYEESQMASSNSPNHIRGTRRASSPPQPPPHISGITDSTTDGGQLENDGGDVGPPLSSLAFADYPPPPYSSLRGSPTKFTSRQPKRTRVPQSASAVVIHVTSESPAVHGFRNL